MWAAPQGGCLWLHTCLVVTEWITIKLQRMFYEYLRGKPIFVTWAGSRSGSVLYSLNITKSESSQMFMSHIQPIPGAKRKQGLRYFFCCSNLIQILTSFHTLKLKQLWTCSNPNGSSYYIPIACIFHPGVCSFAGCSSQRTPQRAPWQFSAHARSGRCFHFGLCVHGYCALSDHLGDYMRTFPLDPRQVCSTGVLFIFFDLVNIILVQTSRLAD